MSIIKRSCETRRKVVIFEPTKRILKHIKEEIPRIASVQPKIACILPNVELCPKLDPSLKLKFQFKENCHTCEYKGNAEACMFQSLLLNDFDVYGLTYDKLRALLIVGSKEAKALLKKMWSCHVFIKDEITTAIVRDIPTLKVKETDENGNIKRFSELVEDLEKEALKIETEADEFFVKDTFWPIVKDFLNQFQNVAASGIYTNECIEGFSEDNLIFVFREGWRYITELTKMHVDTNHLQEVFLVALIAKKVSVICEDGTVTVTPVLEDALGYLREFCKGIPDDKPIFLVDSFQPSVSFDHILGRKVQHELWGPDGDPLGSDKQQLIVCDTAHWGALDFYHYWNLRFKVKFFIEDLLHEFPPQKVLIVTTNKETAQIVSRWKLPKGVRITWHRSDWMRGVSVENRRIIICIGGPYLPRRAYVSPAHSFDIKDFSEELEKLKPEEQKVCIARILNLVDTRSEFVNAIARIKDPKAEERSIVFTLGMTKRDVEILLKQMTIPNVTPHLSRPRCIRPVRKGGMENNGLWIARLWSDHAHVEIEDIPIVARIIRYTHEKMHVPASVILPKYTNYVIEKAERYEHVLNKYNVRIVRKRGGVSFVLNVNLDYFLNNQSQS